MKLLRRIAMIALAAGLFVGLTGIYADSIGPHRNRHGETERRRRPSEPRLQSLPNFLGQFVVMGLIVIGGRMVLRLRLVDPPSL
jgi:hypothetical protein